jgi:hypothetical protein
MCTGFRVDRLVDDQDMINPNTGMLERHWLVAWTGYNRDEWTWEPALHFQGTNLIQRYNNSEYVSVSMGRSSSPHLRDAVCCMCQQER